MTARLFLAFTCAAVLLLAVLVAHAAMASLGDIGASLGGAR
jgi:hypothetical protein